MGEDRGGFEPTHLVDVRTCREDVRGPGRDDRPRPGYLLTVDGCSELTLQGGREGFQFLTAPKRDDPGPVPNLEGKKNFVNRPAPLSFPHQQPADSRGRTSLGSA
jgi:hypothetical protein